MANTSRIINPTAKYDVPIDGLACGESRSVDVAHSVEGHGVDRFKVALHTTRALLLRLTLDYNKNQRVEADIAI